MSANCPKSKNKVKVVMLTSVHPAFDTRIFHKQAKTLLDAGYEVALITQHEKNEIVDGIKIIALPKRKKRLRRMTELPLLTIRFAIKEKANIYHIHDPELLSVGLLLKLFIGVTVIYDIHEDYQALIDAKYWLPPFLRSLAIKVYNIFEKISFLYFDGIIVAGEDILTHFPNNPKVTLIGNYPLLDKVSYVDRTNNERKENYSVIYAGVMERNRCIKESVLAVKMLDGKVDLILLGDFFVDKFEEEIRRLADNHIHILGKVPLSEVFQYMNKACIGLVCLLPSPNNINATSRNNKLYEYMASGLPVISSNFPSWKRFLESNHCGIGVNPENPEEIAKAIEYLIDRPEVMKKMGENGRKAVLEKYNWEKESEKLLNLYATLSAEKES